MIQYIDKSALVAEIERKKIPFKKDIDDGVYPAYLCALMDFEDFINTLEVKEVDLERLEQEVKDFCYEYDGRKDKWYDITPHDKNIMVNPTWANFAMSIAKHFFELGISASNPITVTDREKSHNRR